MGEQLAKKDIDDLVAENASLRERLQEVIDENETLKQGFEEQLPFERVTSDHEAKHGVSGTSLVAFADPIKRRSRSFSISSAVSMHKVIYLVRHAEARHNELEALLKKKAQAEGKDERAQMAAAKLALPEERFRDARLSSKGADQVRNSGLTFQKLLEKTHYTFPKTVLVSPLRRTLMTASILFPDHSDMRALELVRERRTGFPCDERQAATQSKSEYPNVDFSKIEVIDESCDDGYVFRKECLESYSDVARRGDKLIPLIESLQAEIIAIVSHKGFIRELLQDSWKNLLSNPENLKMELSNAEVRVCEFTWLEPGRPPSIVMRSLQTVTVEPTVLVKPEFAPNFRRTRSYSCSADKRRRSHIRAAVATSNLLDVEEAVDEAWQSLRDQLDGLPSVILVFGHCTFCAKRLSARLREKQPAMHVIGGSSMRGVMTGCGQSRLGFIGFDGWAKRCGIGRVGGYRITDAYSAQEAGTKAIKEATDGSVPDIIIMCGSAGFEENILEGINKVFEGVRVFGGSSSNDGCVGGACNPPWQLYGGLAGWGAIDDGGLVLLAVWQHDQSRIHSVLSHCFGSTQHTGLITKAEGREIYEIDEKPAGDVFAEWTGLAFPCPHKDLAQFALAFDKNNVDRLVHLKGVGSQRELQCFASTASEFGCCQARLVKVKASALIGSTREVLKQAIEDVEFDVKIAFVVFGAGTSSLLSEEDFSKMRAILSEFAQHVLMVFSMGGQGKPSSSMDSIHVNNMLNVLFFGG